ncbi:MAG: putative metal-binding motif-containing protein [archaeon]|jgi:hypothetical protein
MYCIGRRAQGTIEYIVLLAIVVVIGLVVVSIISSFSGSAATITKAQSEAYWTVQSVALKGASVNADGAGTLRFENKTGSRITITSVVVDNNTYTLATPITLYPGEESDINFSNLIPCTGVSAEYNVAINYTDSYGLVHSFAGTTPLYVECTSTTTPETHTYYLDYDRDNYGDVNHSQTLSAPDGNYDVTNHTDCNDSNSAIHPLASEIVNGVDDDCDGEIDEGEQYYLDEDRDGFGNETLYVVGSPSGNYDVTDNTDCNDNNAQSYPGATEVCDNMDNNCDGTIDSFSTASGCSQVGYCSGATRVCTVGSFGDCSKTPDTEVCYDDIDNDCDGLTDCDDTDDCTSSNLMCKTPLGILSVANTGGDIAATAADTEGAWDREINFVFRNNSDADVNITRINLTGTTGCDGCDPCDCSQVSRTTSNYVTDIGSVSSPTISGCGGSALGVDFADNPTFSAGSTPQTTIITGGDVNYYWECSQSKFRVIAPGETVGVNGDQVWPDWCVGSWGTASKVLDVTVYFSGGATQTFSSLTVPCREASLVGYVGLFDYVPGLDFATGAFPAPWWPLGILNGSNPYYSGSRMHAAVGSPNTSNYVTLRIKNLSTATSVDINGIKVRGPKVNQADNNYIQTYTLTTISPQQVVDFNVANTAPDVYSISSCDLTWANRTDLNIALYYTGNWGGYPQVFPKGYYNAQRYFFCTNP